MKKTFQVILFILAAIVSTFSLCEETIKIVTEEYPPYSYSENGKITGIATETVEAVLNDLGNETEIKIYPWARAYKMALNEKNVLIFGLNRTQEREDLFKWVGFITSNSLAFFSLQTRSDIGINSLNDAKKYDVGVIIEDSGAQHLLSKGFTRITPVNSDIQNLTKLLIGRIDLWLTDELNGYYVFKKNGHDPNKFIIKYDFQISSGLYMAFSKNTSDELVEEFRESLDNIKENGTYSKIVQKYKYKTWTSHDLVD